MMVTGVCRLSSIGDYWLFFSLDWFHNTPWNYESWIFMKETDRSMPVPFFQVLCLKGMVYSWRKIWRFFFFFIPGKQVFDIVYNSWGEALSAQLATLVYYSSLPAHSVNIFSHPSHQCSYRLYSTIVLSRALLRPKKVLFAFPGFCGYTRLYAYILRFGLRITEKREFAALTFG